MDETTTTIEMAPLAARQAVGRESGLRRVAEATPMGRAAGALLLLLTAASVATALTQVFGVTG